MAPWHWASPEATLLLQALLFTEAVLPVEHASRLAFPSSKGSFLVLIQKRKKKKWRLIQQVRCKNTKLCRSEGVKVILTDLRHRNGTEWVLSRPAYLAMARPGMAKELRGLGTVDVEYER